MQITVLLIGTLAMLGIMLYSFHKYQLPMWKAIPISIISTLVGVCSIKLMVYIESGSWNGQSFFGAVLFAPIIMCLVARVFRIKTMDLLDICAPAECGMLIFQKVNCIVNGCCEGRIIFHDQHGVGVQFPSQTVECITAVILLWIFLCMIQEGRNHGKVYFWYMILYGCARFILNLFRETIPFVWILPAGNFWSIISIIIGLISMLFIKKMNTQNPNDPNRRERCVK